MSDQEGLREASTGSIQRLLHISKANGWEEIVDDARAELESRTYRDPPMK